LIILECSDSSRQAIEMYMDISHLTIKSSKAFTEGDFRKKKIKRGAFTSCTTRALFLKQLRKFEAVSLNRMTA
jgi:hypothetical protein